jgi:hypothetical protein
MQVSWYTTVHWPGGAPVDDCLCMAINGEYPGFLKGLTILKGVLNAEFISEKGTAKRDCSAF